ncbi:MFS transporter [Streptomyces sp. NBC_00424]|nr:MFS transporter [Streptomyces sp. NBC_00424]MCX5071095.1 MFS transporter [Streptomyces sp. NBC_00424]
MWWTQNVPRSATQRRFVLASLIDSAGTGVHFTIFPLYLILIVHISAVQVGTGLLLASLVGMLMNIPVGRACDLVGPRAVLALGYAAQALVAGLLILIRDVVAFTLLVTLGKVASQAVRLGRNVLVAGAGGDQRNVLRAQMNASSNIGLAAGMGISAIILVDASPAAFEVGFLINCASFVSAAVVQCWAKVPAKVPATAPRDRAGGRVRAALKDVKYCSVGLLNGLLGFHQQVFFLGLPLWIAAHGGVPRSLTSLVFFVNFVLTVLLQVRASSTVHNYRDALGAWRKSGLWLALGFGILAAFSHSSPWLVALAVVVMGTLLTFGEIWYGAAEFELSVALAPRTSLGLYQGVFELGSDAFAMAGPLLATLVCVSMGQAGWATLALVYLAFALLAPRVVEWAARGREQAEQPLDQAVTAPGAGAAA